MVCGLVTLSPKRLVMPSWHLRFLLLLAVSKARFDSSFFYGFAGIRAIKGMGFRV